MFKPYSYQKLTLKEKRLFPTPKLTFSLKPSLPSLFNFKEIVSFFLIFLGVSLISTQIILPSLRLNQQTGTIIDVGVVLGTATPQEENSKDFTFSELTREPSPPVESGNGTPPPSVFYLSIEKLGIKDALVETNSTKARPDEKIGHYKGSSLPGEEGNVFLYGHSVLPWFFNPKNYSTIFSTLPNLEPKDEIVVNFNAKDFHYLVEAKKTMNPEEVNPLKAVEGKGGYLTLMTCVPPGLKTKRLLVIAKLAEKD